MEVNHSAHPHPLYLREQNNAEGFCFLCLESIVGNPFYVCADCKVYVHRRCVELPSVIDHPFHPQHSLNLRHGLEFWCDSCHRKFGKKPHFTCNTCDFDLDVKCTLMPKPNQEGEEFIQHFSHQHQMILCCQNHDKFLTCFACKKITPEVVYGCIPCEYFLHKSCSELPTPLLHTLHLQHPLHLRIKHGLCQICNVYDHTFKFSCDCCDFSMDVSCWMKHTWKKEGQNLEGACFICSKQHLDSFSCVDSKYLLNQTCIPLPKEINHQFHSHKPLQLLAPNDFWCDSCHKWSDTKLCYGSCDSNFHMDVKCALMPMVQQNEGVKYLSQSLPCYFSHQHPLCLITVDFGIICSVCQMTRPSPIYGCLQCEYFLHQSCIELPSEIESPLHGPHKLTMELVLDGYCHLCLRKYSGFFFECVECIFFIGIECYALIPKFNIRYPYHKHPLCLVEKSYSKKCDVNDTFCRIFKFSSEPKLGQAYLLRCVQCNYSVHLLCSELPDTTKDKYHLHCLTLTDSVVEFDCDDYYCDICEEERDPRFHVYWCEDCDFVSHVHCVTNEIINAWKKNYEPLDSRIARDLKVDEMKYLPCYHANGKTLNLKNVLASLSENETKKIQNNFPRAKLYDKNYCKIDEAGSTSKYQQSDIIQEISMYKDDEGRSTCKYQRSDIIQELSMYKDEEAIFKILAKKVKQFQRSRKYLIQPHEYELAVVEVEDYMITSNFASLLSALFRKYGDFSAHTRFQKNFKCVIFYLLCRTVHDMRSTCMADLTERQHIEWVYYWERARHLGFDIDFGYPFLQSSFLTCTGLRAMKLENELPNKVALEIAEREKKISEIRSQIEKLKSFASQYEPGNDKIHDHARRYKWNRAWIDII